MLRRISLSLMFLLAISVHAGQSLQLTILHNNDLHGMLMPFDYMPTDPFAIRHTRGNAGGLTRFATAVTEQRAATANPLVLINTGDIFARGPWHTMFYGMLEVEAMNLLGYEMLTVGNNEFKATDGTDSQQKMLALMRRSRFPWMAANLTTGQTAVPVEGIHPFIVRVYQGVRIGFLGITAPRAAEYPQTRGWTISDPIATAKTWVPIARKECDILIAVTHIGYVSDRQLAAEVDGIDAIVGGDSHTILVTPTVIANPRGQEVPIVQAGEHGVFLGKFDLTFEQTDTGWQLKSHTGKLIIIDTAFADDAAMKQLLEQWIPTPAAWLPAVELRLAA